MRADRLVATVMLLQVRGRMTAEQVAAETEVSVATARRDLEALAAAGVPVYPQPGRGGGWRLVGGARTDLSGLSATESEALFLLLGPAARARPEARSALRKLVRALPATFRDAAQTASESVLIDRTPWGQRAGPGEHRLAELEAAVVGRQVLRLRYRPRTGGETTPTVRPLGLVDKDRTWYLVADGDRGRRTYRVDRIVDVETTGVVFEPPTDLDLDAEWRSTVREVEDRRARVVATVRVPGRFVSVVMGQFGSNAEVVASADPDSPDGPVDAATLRLRAHLLVGMAEQLAGWGDRIEVLDPPELRAELARIGAQLVSRYGPDA